MNKEEPVDRQMQPEGSSVLPASASRSEEIQAIVLDFDDTLYSHKTNEIPAATSEALRRLKANGYLLGLCTSRFPSEFSRFDPSMFSIFDAIIEGTGSIVVKDGKMLSTSEIRPDTAGQIISYLCRENLPFLWITPDLEEHFSMDPGSQIRNFFMDWRGFCPDAKPWSGQRIMSIAFYDADAAQKEAIRQIGRETSIQFWGMSGQINADHVDKALGLQKFASLLHIKVSQIAAFGDGLNDITMLESAGIGIATGGSSAELQQHADMVAAPIEEGGIYLACRQLGLF